MSSSVILSLGSINAVIELKVDRLPGKGEKIAGNHFLISSGGKAANVAYIAQRLGATVRLIAKTGDDMLAAVALEPLRQIGMDLTYTKHATDSATGVESITVSPDGTRQIVFAENANHHWTRDDLLLINDAIESAPKGSLLSTDLEIPDFVVEHALREARKRNLITVLDPSPATRMKRELYPLVDFVTPSRIEAQRLVGYEITSLEDAFRAGNDLRKLGATIAIIKLGRDGCAIVTETSKEQIPAADVKVEDRAGAGDAFTGALAVSLIEHHPPREAARFAQTAAALSTMHYGLQESYPVRKEVEAKMRH